jgi:hypothetical protein
VALRSRLQTTALAACLVAGIATCVWLARETVRSPAQVQKPSAEFKTIADYVAGDSATVVPILNAIRNRNTVPLENGTPADVIELINRCQDAAASQELFCGIADELMAREAFPLAALFRNAEIQEIRKGSSLPGDQLFTLLYAKCASSPENLLLDVCWTSKAARQQKLSLNTVSRLLSDRISAGEETSLRRQCQSLHRRLGLILGQKLEFPRVDVESAVPVTGRFLLNGTPQVNATVIAIPASSASPAQDGHLLTTALENPDWTQAAPLIDGIVTATTDASGLFTLPLQQDVSYWITSTTIQIADKPLHDIQVTVQHAPPKSGDATRGWRFADPAGFHLGDVLISFQPDRPSGPPLLRTIIHEPPPNLTSGEQVVIPIDLINGGGAPLAIAAGQTDCGCSKFLQSPQSTDPVTFPMVIVPNGSVRLYLSVATSRGPVGVFTKGFRLHTNDAFNPTFNGSVRFETRERLKLVPAESTLSISRTTGVQTQHVVIQSDQPLTIDKVVSQKPQFKVTVDPDARGFTVAVDPDDIPANQRDVRTRLTLSLSDSLEPVVYIVTATRSDQVAVTPPKLNLGPAVQGSEIRRRFVVRSAEPIDVNSVTSTAGIDIKSIQIKGQIVDVEFTLAAAMGPAKLQFKLADETVESSIYWSNGQ